MHKADAVSYFGSQQKLAEALGIRQASVSGWKDVVPLGRAFIIERITRGRLRVKLSLYPSSCRKPALARRGHVAPR